MDRHSDAERPVVDQLVNALYSGDSVALEAAGTELARIWQEGDSAEEIDSGIMLEDTALIRENINTGGWAVEELETHVSNTRYQELLQGADLTQPERDVLVRGAAEEVLGFESGGDSYDLWRILRVCSADGREAFVALLVSGCSWEGITCRFVGAFRTEPDARVGLKAVGFISVDDFRERYRPGA